jgi:hypothetical protein
MNEQEINYFLDGVTAKQDLIESIEALRSELATAMAPMMEPKLKEPQRDDTSYLLSRDYLTPGQKIIVLWMEANTKAFEWTKFTIQMIADGTTMSRKHVRESLFKLKELRVVRHSCDVNKWYMPEDFAMELHTIELNGVEHE